MISHLEQLKLLRRLYPYVKIQRLNWEKYNFFPCISVARVSNVYGARVSNVSGARVSNVCGARFSNVYGARVSNVCGARVSNVYCIVWILNFIVLVLGSQVLYILGS